MQGARSMADLAQRREAIAGAVAAVADLDAHLYQAAGAELGPLLGELDRFVTAGEAGRVAVLGEAMQRGETGSGPGATSPAQWLRRWAPSLRAGGAASVVTLATAFTKPANAPVKEAVDAGELP
ncbi:MAG TPA: hypothetical protein VFG97_11110, partial [Pedococcus sp.]|nr:hypothetical protein [Pedococcus sp.]